MANDDGAQTGDDVGLAHAHDPFDLRDSIDALPGLVLCGMYALIAAHIVSVSAERDDAGAVRGTRVCTSDGARFLFRGVAPLDFAHAISHALANLHR